MWKIQNFNLCELKKKLCLVYYDVKLAHYKHKDVCFNSTYLYVTFFYLFLLLIFFQK